MTEQELRSLVREAIARYTAESSQVHPRPAAPSPLRTLAPSHLLFALPESDGPCLIEPAVACNHCGFCKSFGH